MPSKKKPIYPAGLPPTSLGLTKDAFQNLLARTGYGAPNLMEATQYPLTRLSKDYNLMNSLYRGSWLARRVVDIIPKDMMKNWIKYTSDIRPEELEKLHKTERLTNLRESLRHGLNWGRLYGGAAGLMLIDGQEDKLSEPLDVDTIMPGDFRGLLIVDRWAGVYPQLELVSDINSPEFGLPEYYHFQDYAKKANHRVHHSRIIRFTGCDLPEWEKMAEVYWGSSVIENVYEEIKKRDNTSANIAGLVFLSNLRILKMNDLGELISATNQNAQNDFINTIQAQNQLMSSMGMYVMSKDDDFQSVQTNFSGLNEIYESFMMDLSGAAQIPMTKLFGRSPAGLNATGESDMRNYNGVVEQEQESKLRPAIGKLLPVLCMSTFGEIPDDIDFVFNPIETPTEKDLADSIKAKTEVVLAFHDRGIISDQIAIKEAKQMSEGSGVFTNITDEDINKARKETGPPVAPPDDDPKTLANL